MKISTCSTKSKLAMLFSVIASVSMLPAIADSYVSYTGKYTEEPHPTLEGVNVVKLTNSGTLTVDEDVRLVRILLVGGGGGGGRNGKGVKGAGGLGGGGILKNLFHVHHAGARGKGLGRRGKQGAGGKGKDEISEHGLLLF